MLVIQIWAGSLHIRHAFPKQLLAFTSLRSLTVRKAYIPETTFVTAMPLLGQLHLPDSFDVSLGPLRSCSRLHSLAIGSADGDSGGLAPLASLVQLRRLQIRAFHTLQPLENLFQLEELTIR